MNDPEMMEMIGQIVEKKVQQATNGDSFALANPEVAGKTQTAGIENENCCKTPDRNNLRRNQIP